MINISDKKDCCGCNACVQRCPKHCITMCDDEEGFAYPHVNQDLCVDCGVCEQVCPVLHPKQPRTPLAVYAAKNANESQRLQSSSGGLFILLAEQTIRQGGVVFGARFDKEWQVEHCYAETLDDLEPLMRSKYLQSRIGNTFREAELFLKQGRQVLFVGTSCQIAGLRNFLRRDYDNLLVVDFICHGVPSPGIWKRYLNDITGKSAQSAAAGKNTVLYSSIKDMPAVSGINFREKKHGFGWKKFGFVVQTSPVKGDKNSVLLSSVFDDNVYMKAFLNNLILRPSCYACVAKQGTSGADITIADFWGIEKIHPEFDDDKGVGLVFLHTAKGAEMWKQITPQLSTITSTVEEATEHNISYLRPVGIPSKRDLFWITYKKTNSLEEAFVKATRLSISEKVMRRLNRYKAITSRIIRGILFRTLSA